MVTRPEVLKNGAVLGLKIIYQPLKGKQYYINAGNKKIYISGNPLTDMTQKPDADIMVVPNISLFKKNLHDSSSTKKWIIITGGGSFSNASTINNSILPSDSVHVIQKSGAFIKSL